jgi:hypothetical protein
MLRWLQDPRWPLVTRLLGLGPVPGGRSREPSMSQVLWHAIFLEKIDDER